MYDDEIDIDEATLEVIRANDSKIERLGVQIEEAGTDASESQIIEFIEAAKAQESLLAEVPGLEAHAKRMRGVIEQAQHHYGV